MFRMVPIMIKNTILIASLVLSSVLAMSILAKADFGTQAFGQALTPKMHLEEGIKALKKGDNEGALMHLNEADKGLADSSSSSDQSAKMHLDEGIKALKNADNEGALMHLGVADKALGGTETG
jgi:Small metal-binding protein